jgi:ketosteroid isomerase-like protein
MDEFTRKGSAELLLESLADDVTWEATAPAGTPLHERFTGREGVIEYFRRAGELLVLEDVRLTDYFHKGDKVVVLGTERLHVRRTGATGPGEWATVVTFRGDKIAHVRVIEDLSILLADRPARAA